MKNYQIPIFYTDSSTFIQNKFKFQPIKYNLYLQN